MINPALTVQLGKHLTYLRHLNAASRPTDQQRRDIVRHAEALHMLATDLLEQATAEPLWSESDPHPEQDAADRVGGEQG